tara:strand:+ start:299 stop:646 length:348 start_codon:yes stop_codon:yes gene_type:complete
MKKLFNIYFLLASLCVFVMPFNSSANTWANASGKISTIQVWANGSDTYGIWVKLEPGANIPSGCGEVFYLQHTASNKDYVYSGLLATKMSGGSVNIQTDKRKNAAGQCRIHKVSF